MRLISRLATIAFLLALVASPAFGQATTGSLNGTVTHEGGPLPGVTVTIASPSLQGTRVSVSNVNGDFNFPALPPGEYTVKFEMQGMANVTRTAKVSIAASARVNAALVLTTMAEAITVTASAPAILETSELQSSVSADLVESLPVARTIQGAVTLAPGVTTNGPSGNIEISGAQSFDNVYYVNGSVVNEVLRGQPLSTYIEDAVQETSILTGAISAEYGRFTGGVVSVVTRSGGNEFYGSFRDSFNDPSWLAQSPLNEPKAESDLQETYEATLGGRIIRDRLWFHTAGRYQDRSTLGTYFDSTDTYLAGTEESRLEGKLTGQISPKHTLVGSYVGVDRTITDTPFTAAYEPSVLDDRKREETSRTLNYNGILSTDFLLEANYADSKIKFIDDGGPRTDFAHGTNVADGNTGAYMGAPTFGASEWGTNNYRASEDYLIKGTYYLASSSAGTHNIVAGYDRFTDLLHEDNGQSA